MNKYLSTSLSLSAILMITPFMALSSKSFIMMWVMMEINNLAFIFFAALDSKNSYLPLNFFLIQSIASLSMTIFIMLNHKSTQEYLWTNINLILMTSLMMKMSLPPFHTWMIKLSKIASWNMNTMFITWQKIIPILMLVKFHNLKSHLIFFLMSITGTLLMLMLSKMKPLMTASSIVHIGWMMIPQMALKTFPIFYLTIYSAIILPLTFQLKKTNKWKLMKPEQKNNLILIMNILNLSGIPPLLGFILKWTAFSIMIEQKVNTILILALFMSASMSFYIYFQITYNAIIKVSGKNKMKANKHSKYNSPHLIIMLLLPILVIM